MCVGANFSSLSFPFSITPKVSSWQRSLWASWWHLHRCDLSLPLVSRDTYAHIRNCMSKWQPMWYCLYWVCEVQTHTHTHTLSSARRGSGQTGRECGSQWPVCSPLWWAPHELSPPLISHSPVVKATHRPLYCLISLWHLWDTHARSPTHMHFSICFGLFIYVCNFVCARRVCSVQPLHMNLWSCVKLHRGIFCCVAPATQSRYSHHPMTVTNQ